jgi:hypothetical protein
MTRAPARVDIIENLTDDERAELAVFPNERWPQVTDLRHRRNDVTGVSSPYGSKFSWQAAKPFDGRAGRGLGRRTCRAPADTSRFPKKPAVRSREPGTRAARRVQARARAICPLVSGSSQRWQVRGRNQSERRHSCPQLAPAISCSRALPDTCAEQAREWGTPGFAHTAAGERTTPERDATNARGCDERGSAAAERRSGSPHPGALGAAVRPHRSIAVSSAKSQRALALDLRRACSRARFDAREHRAADALG